MKLAARAIERFLAAPDPEVAAVLLFGPDAGLVRERAERLCRAVAGDLGDPFRLTELSPAALREVPTRLADEAAALSLGGGRRVVRLREAGDTLTGRLAEVLEGTAAALVVAEAGELGTKSTLRKLFETAPRAAAIACYPEEGADLGRFIAGELRRQGVALAPEALDYLLVQLGQDRALNRAELEKLALYAGGQAAPLSLAEVVACIGDGAGLAVDELALAVADGEPAAVDRALARELADGGAPISLLRAVSRHFQRLHLVVGMMAEGAGLERALSALRPPLFIRVRDRFVRQAGRWSPAELAQALDRLLAAELACKRTGAPDEAILWRALTEIARARPRDRRRA
ncbi:MAG: DNA polymerase III subunit delta [Dongiaceae bacterium]